MVIDLQEIKESNATLLTACQSSKSLKSLIQGKIF